MGDDLFPILVAQLHEQVVSGDPRIGDENVELSHRFLGTRHQRFGLGKIGEIGGQNVHAAAKLSSEPIEHLAARS